jgi:YebC/PmpR family DNA-binding regulatory protein
MSGHSKWAGIKHKKAIVDAKKGKVFSQYSKLISIAAKSGGEPEMNPTLRLAIENARKVNMPNDNIIRAIKKGTGEDKEGITIEEITYEAIGAAASAFLIECLTDNRNRTYSNIRMILNKKGANQVPSGSVSWMFEKKGVIVVKKNKSDDELEMAAIDANADDVEMEDDVMIVYTKVENFIDVKTALEKQGLTIEDASLKQIAKNTVKIENKEDINKIVSLIEAVEEDEDVSNVYVNFEM